MGKNHPNSSFQKYQFFFCANFSSKYTDDGYSIFYAKLTIYYACSYIFAEHFLCQYNLFGAFFLCVHCSLNKLCLDVVMISKTREVLVAIMYLKSVFGIFGLAWLLFFVLETFCLKHINMKKQIQVVSKSKRI